MVILIWHVIKVKVHFFAHGCLIFPAPFGTLDFILFHHHYDLIPQVNLYLFYIYYFFIIVQIAYECYNKTLQKNYLYSLSPFPHLLLFPNHIIVN